MDMLGLMEGVDDGISLSNVLGLLTGLATGFVLGFFGPSCVGLGVGWIIDGCTEG